MTKLLFLVLLQKRYDKEQNFYHMKIKNGFVLREMCGEKIVTGVGMEHVNFNKLISLNSTAAYLWEELVGKEFTVEDAAQLLVDQYEIDMELALADSAKLCEAWKNAGVLD